MSKGWLWMSGLVVGFILGIASVKPVKRAWFHHIDAVSCSHVRVVKLSPDGVIRATLTTEGCDYGFGLAASIAKIRIEKRGSDGWFWNKLMYESPDSDFAPTVTLAWLSNTALEADVETHSMAGSYAQYQPGFTFEPPRVSRRAPGLGQAAMARPDC
jgi:hypothetical protein